MPFNGGYTCYSPVPVSVPVSALLLISPVCNIVGPLNYTTHYVVPLNEFIPPTLSHPWTVNCTQYSLLLLFCENGETISLQTVQLKWVLQNILYWPVTAAAPSFMVIPIQGQLEGRARGVDPLY